METNPKTLGESLKHARETKNLTLRQVEELTQISNAYLSQLENNKIKKPSANILYKLAKLYGIDFDFLLEATGIIEKVAKGEKSDPSGQKPKSLAGFALRSEDLTAEEEEELVDYLKYLRYKGKNEKKKD